MRLISIALPLLVCSAIHGATVSVVVKSGADPLEKLAAAELAQYLTKLYPSDHFRVAPNQPGKEPCIVLGTPASVPELTQFKDRLGKPESFVVSSSGVTGYIAGADPRGALYGVYALLEKLGYGFYISYDALSAPRKEPFSFAAWKLADAPLVADRIVFDWHNFLSSASTWEFADWQHYIDHSARMRFNDMMVHAYGNNPMFTFQFGGMTKPVGYLATTRVGRDWGTEHVNDVRNMIGGNLFHAPVFGSSVATGDLEQRVPATRELMRRVFAYAVSRGMHNTFALDVDTESANPQALIATLPPSARLSVGGIQLVNPETPEGHAYYRAELEQLLECYPQITRLAIWFRGGRNSPWREITRAEFPRDWQEQYDRALKSKTYLRADPEAPSMFAIAKIAVVFRTILDETGHHGTELAAGSWQFDFVRAADTFLPARVTLLPLDYAYAFTSDPVQETLRVAGRHRPIVPIVWAQHDDREFAGRPYLPFSGFASLLRRANSAGFGIIHWTTRPLDLYFKNLSKQVWEESENEQIETTCRQMAERTFGLAARESATQYLLSWIQDAPIFGRETSDRFINQDIDESQVAVGSARRLHLLKTVAEAASSSQATAWVGYFEDWENFALDFHRAQAAWQRSRDALAAGNFEDARRELTKVSPDAVIAKYAQTIAHDHATRGELGILVSLNLRWLPYFISARQAAGLDPVRIRIDKVDQEPLAQGAGHNTFYFDDQHQLWRVFDREAIEGKLRTGAIMGDRLEPGRYSINGGTPQEAIGGQLEIEIPADIEQLLITRAN